MLREPSKTDLDRIREIHEKYYKNEFPFPNLDHFMSFLVAYEGSKIIAAGGVRSIAELIVITDQDTPIFSRKRNLTDLLWHSKTVASAFGYSHLYSHSEGAEWIKAQKLIGFKQFKAVPLVLKTGA